MHLKKNSQELQNSDLFKALMSEDRTAFNTLRNTGDCTSFEDAQLRGIDLRGFNLTGLNFKGAYLRNADLRGLDLRQTEMEGASVRESQISGTFFPLKIQASEIILSHQHGTRLRYKTHHDIDFESNGS